MPIENIVCEECGKPITPTKALERSFEKAKAKGMSELMIECPHCGLATDVVLKQPPPARPSKDPEHELTYHCPTSGCTGFAVYVEPPMGPFWGCGECGGEWASRPALVSDIQRAIRRFPYRARVYEKKSGGDLLPADFAREPDSYNDRVEREPIEEAPQLPRSKSAKSGKKKSGKKKPGKKKSGKKKAGRKKPGRKKPGRKKPGRKKPGKKARG